MLYESVCPLGFRLDLDVLNGRRYHLRVNRLSFGLSKVFNYIANSPEIVTEYSIVTFEIDPCVLFPTGLRKRAMSILHCASSDFKKCLMDLIALNFINFL